MAPCCCQRTKLAFLVKGKRVPSLVELDLALHPGSATGCVFWGWSSSCLKIVPPSQGCGEGGGYR